jgi:hypothetical protein
MDRSPWVPRLVDIAYFVAVYPWEARPPAVPYEKWLEALARSAVRVSVSEPRTYDVTIDLESRK